MPEPPTLIGPYSVTREIGRGGMGVVYLARDTKLDRDVAIKALPEELADDADRLVRFEREAKVLAQLNHSNVAGIHGVEEQDGQKYLILEYVEGETLAERLDRGARPIDAALYFASESPRGGEPANDVFMYVVLLTVLLL
ncbi:MAG: protein kinase, partial [Planctomycetota bacterium]|nr:protein kinase [Planctomycetota bacterium]